jgi:release factor glutamine methyltransferase
MLVKDVLQKTTQFFRDKGIDTARLDTEILISEALHWERMKIYLNYEYPMKEEELSACRELVRRRAAGEPVAYILGKKDFYKHTFKVSPAVLIPRPETETLVEETVIALREASEASDADLPRIIDFGTGSGCIGLSLLAELPDADLLAIDISPEAIAIAQENATAIDVHERAKFMTADISTLDTAAILKLMGGPVDAVVANPPYISFEDPTVEANVKKYEPGSALFSDENGLAHVRTWAAKAAELVREGGWVMFEIGHDQGNGAGQIFARDSRYADVRVVQDLSGRDRFITATRSSSDLAAKG